MANGLLGSQLVGRSRPTSGKTNGSKPILGGAFSSENLGGTLSGLAEGLSATAAGWSPNPETRQMFAQIASEYRGQREARRQQRLEIALQGFDQVERLLTNAPELRGTQAAVNMVDLAEKNALTSGGDSIPGLSERVQALRQFAQTPLAPEAPDFQKNLQSLQDMGIEPSTEQIVKAAGFDLPPEHLGQLQQTIDTLRRNKINPSSDQIMELAKLVGGGQVISASVDKDGKLVFQVGGSGGATSGMGGLPVSGGVTPAQSMEHNERLDQFSQIDESLTDLIAAGEADATLFGTVGTIKKGLKEVGRIGEEAGVLPGKLGETLSSLGKAAEEMAMADTNIDPAAKAELLDTFSTGGLEAEEAKLGYLYARTVLQPNDRLLVDTIRAAQNSTKLFTLGKSQKTIMERLRQIQKGVQRVRQGVVQSLPVAQPTPAAQGPQGAGVDILQEARDAIAKGADPAAVKKRLMELGGDPSQL